MADGVAERHQGLARRIREYLDGPGRTLPTGRALGPRLGGATVLAVGAHALGADGPVTPVEVEVILAEEEWARLLTGARPSDLLTLDPGAGLEVRIRGTQWLTGALESPGGLWLHQRAAIVQDPLDQFAPAVRQALQEFRAGLEARALQMYRAFREGFETADALLEPCGRLVETGRAVEAALALPVLARGEPWPPTRWMAWYLARVDPEGERMAALAIRAAGGPPVDREAYASLRRLVDDTLERAGYAQSLVRAYRALA